MIPVRISRYQTAQVDRNRYRCRRPMWGGNAGPRWVVRGSAVCGRAADRQPSAIFGNSRWQVDPLHYLELIRQRVGVL